MSRFDNLTDDEKEKLWKTLDDHYALLTKTKWYYALGGLVGVLIAAFAMSLAGTAIGLRDSRVKAAIAEIEEHRNAAERARAAIDDFATIQDFALTSPASLGDRTIYVRASRGTHPGMVRVIWRPVREAVAYEFWRSRPDKSERLDYKQETAESFGSSILHWDDTSADAQSGSNFVYTVQCYFVAGDGQRLPRFLGSDSGFGGAGKKR